MAIEIELRRIPLDQTPDIEGKITEKANELADYHIASTFVHSNQLILVFEKRSS